MSNWLDKNPWKAFGVVVMASLLFLYALSIFYGCGHAPRRFQDGDRTVMSPPTYQEVTEPDMVKPEPEPN